MKPPDSARLSARTSARLSARTSARRRGGPESSPPPAAPHADTAPARGRYAPSPTGLLHLGNARTALAAWLSVRSHGGSFVWRVEDLDPPRVMTGAAEAAVADLKWFGIDWDEDPQRGGPLGPYLQSQRNHLYEQALDILHKAGRLFPCTLSRKELSSIASAPHVGEEEAPYPVLARPVALAEDWYGQLANSGGAALRFLVRDEPVRFLDLVQGAVEQRVVGDFVLKRRDGLYAYHLAVVVDDWRMKINEVVRGADLLSSTGRQLQLGDALGAPRPVHAHVPMVLGHHGEKLSKRDGAITLAALRDAGIRAPQLVGYLAWSLGLLDRPSAVEAGDLVAGFDWARVTPADWRLPADFIDHVRAVR